MTSKRCHLCGREGTLGFVVAAAAYYVLTDPQAGRRRRAAHEFVTICTARRACNQRRGVPG